MSALYTRLNDELALGPYRHLAAVVEVSRLQANHRERLCGDPALQWHPLLSQPEFGNLRWEGPALLTTGGSGLHNLDRLFERTEQLRSAVSGWLVSSVSVAELALHLANANVMTGPDGARYLLRYHAPHVVNVLHRAQMEWSRAFFSPLVSWWSLQSGGHWLRYAGGALNTCALLPPLHASPSLWNEINGADAEPYAVLAHLEELRLAPFDTTCPGSRVAIVEALLAEATQYAISGAANRRDYVLLRLEWGEALLRNPHWTRIIKQAGQPSWRLLDAWLSVA